MKSDDENAGGTQKASLLTLAAAVFWSFLGIRRKKDYASDAASISVSQAIIAGIVGGIIFVVGVLVLVKVILASIGTSA